MNPLIAEYVGRQGSRHAPTARGAREVLLACIHEAGHWMALAHFNVPVLSAVVDRRSNIVSGCVTPIDLERVVPAEMEATVDYIATLAGPATHCALIPFTAMETIRASSSGDEQDARKLFDRVFGSDRAARKRFREECVPQVEQLIRKNWPTIEALAYELMSCGKFNFPGECRKVEERYGIGGHFLTATRKESARRRLAAFDSSPDELLMSLRVNM